MPFMLPFVIKNLFSKPFTVRHPIERREPFPEHRGRIEFDMEKCDLCQDCERFCPSFAIKVDPEAGVIAYDPFKCIYCHVCVHTCMQRAIIGDSKYEQPAYAKEIKYYRKKW